MGKSVLVNGTPHGDELIGGRKRDWFSGRQGDDIILGNKGSDILNGGAGEDLIDGGPGRDWLTLSPQGGSHVVDLSAGVASVLGENDTLVGIENVVTAGTLFQEGISYNVIGDSNNNRLVSAGGDSIFTGGAGADEFQLEGILGPWDSPVVITDFETGRDVAIFTEGVLAVFDPYQFELLPTGRLSSDLFALGTPAESDDLFIFDSESGSLSIDADGTGPIDEVILMVFENNVQISASDIVIVQSLFDHELRPPFADPEQDVEALGVGSGVFGDADLLLG